MYLQNTLFQPIQLQGSCGIVLRVGLKGFIGFSAEREGLTEDDCLQIIMEREASNPEFGFLYNLASPEHAYYRWRLFSLAQGVHSLLKPKASLPIPYCDGIHQLHDDAAEVSEPVKCLAPSSRVSGLLTRRGGDCRGHTADMAGRGLCIAGTRPPVAAACHALRHCLSTDSSTARRRGQGQPPSVRSFELQNIFSIHSLSCHILKRQLIMSLMYVGKRFMQSRVSLNTRYVPGRSLDASLEPDAPMYQ